jgi:hypothetical protein
VFDFVGAKGTINVKGLSAKRIGLFRTNARYEDAFCFARLQFEDASTVRTTLNFAR